MDESDSEVRSPAAKRIKNLDDNFLKVSNLPDKFMENTFRAFLEKYRLRKGIYPHEQRTIIKCEKYLKDGYVRVEFINSDIVEELASKTDAYFQKKFLVLEAPIYLNETLTSSRAINDSVAGAEGDGIAMIDLTKSQASNNFGAGPQTDNFVLPESTHSGASNNFGARPELDNTVLPESTQNPCTSTPKNSTTAEVVDLFQRLTPFRKNLSTYFKDVPVKSVGDDALFNGKDDISEHDKEDRRGNISHIIECNSDKASKDRGVPTSQVGIYNLTAGFDKNDIIYEIHKSLWKHKAIEKPCKPIIASDTVDETTLILTFDCPEHATLAVDLPKAIEYDDTFLTLEQIFQEVPKRTTNTVKISHLPEGFEARDVVYEIHKALWKHTNIEKPCKPIIASDTVDETTLILTFDCPEHATLAVDLSKAIEYDDTFLTLEQIFQEVPKRTTNTVKISHLPEGFEARDVVYEIHKALWKHTNIEKPCKPIIASDTVDETTLILTFDCPEHATLAVDLPNAIEYDDTFLTLEHIYHEDAPITPTPVLDIDEMNGGHSSWSGMPEESVVEETTVDKSQEKESLATVSWDDKGYPAIPAGIVARTDWPTFETLKLIEAMLNFKDNLTHRNTHCQKKGYVALGKFMYERRLYYTARNMKGRIKGLVTTYESDSADPSWEYRELIAMYLGEKPFDASVLTDMLAKYKPTSAPKRRSLVQQNKIACGVVILANCKAEELPHLFDDKNTFMLIASYHAFKSLFDDDLHRSDELYADISKKLKKFGCSASAEDCSKRMGFLANKYKQIEDMRLLCTGTGDVTNWIYYDAMSQIFEKSRVMKPQKLLAAGTASVSKSRNDDDEEEEEDQNNNGSSFRGRKKKKKKKTNSYTSAVPINLIGKES